MSQKLPTHGFKWMDVCNLTYVKKLLEKKDTKIGYIFEVDLEYPSSLWEEHNDYPLAPERIKIVNVDKLFFPKRIMYYIIKT